MAEDNFASESGNITQSLEQMYMNAPVGKMLSLQNGISVESSCSATLSPPPTLEVNQKRERSESLMLHHINDSIATKRRLRSRSRLGLSPEDIPSAFMSPPMSSKPHERTYSRYENGQWFPEATIDHPETSSVYLTPYSEPREPLKNKDNIYYYGEKWCSNIQLEDCIDNGSTDDQATLSPSDKTRVKLNFDKCADGSNSQMLLTNSRISFCTNKIIGWRMGIKRIDFIKEFKIMNCELIYQQIFSYLESKDLLRVASVSKLWREVCKKDRIASPRLEQYITNQKQHVIQKGKENFGYHTKFDNSVPQRQPLSIQNDNIRKPQPKEVSTDLNEVREKLLYTYERIKCPYCLSPSKKTDEWWECKKCQHVFCSVCQCRVDENHKTGQCSHKLNTENAKQISIGSKKSKDRLKRF